MRALLALIILLLHGASAAAPGPIAGVPTGVAGFVGLAAQGPFHQPVAIESPEGFLEVFGEFDQDLPLPYLAPSVAAFFRNGGLRCWVVRVEDDADGSLIGSEDPRRPTGLAALAGVDEVALVAIPGAASPAVHAALIAHGEVRGDRLALLDAGPEDDASAVLDRRAGLISEDGRAALLFPWLEAEPGLGPSILPPSGAVAGLLARTDAEAGVWQAPRGEVRGASGLALPVSERDLEELASAGVTALRSLPGTGVRVWSWRTTSFEAELRYVNVRRLLIYLEESIHEGTAWAVFEPNDEPLWSVLRREVEDFFIAAWRDGALQGARPEEAFFVRVDRTTMTAADLAEGRTVILVGMALLQPAEFRIIRVSQERPAAAVFRRGDANGDGEIDLSDAVAIFGFLFLGDPAPGCQGAADLDGSGELDISDPIYGLEFLFRGGPAPPGPFPDCGEGPPGPPGCSGDAGCR